MPDSKAELKELLTETKFYCLQALTSQVEFILFISSCRLISKKEDVFVHYFTW